MSQYIEFYIKDTNNYFIPIGIYSRCTKIYQIAHDATNVPAYSNVAPLTSTALNNILDAIRTEVRSFEERINKLEEEKRLVATFNNSVEEKSEKIFEIDNDIADWKEIIEEYQNARGFYYTLAEMLDSTRYAEKINKDEYIYFGIECDNPNKEEE